MFRLLTSLERTIDNTIVAPVATVVIDGFAKVESVQVCPASSIGLQRLWVRTGDERLSELASIAREAEEPQGRGR
jgi:hypothetical protein